MDKLDLRKQLKHLYQPSAKKVEVVDVPPLLFAMIDGAIEPGSEPGMSPAFAEALQALYGISYTLKFMCKQRAENPDRLHRDGSGGPVVGRGRPVRHHRQGQLVSGGP